MTTIYAVSFVFEVSGRITQLPPLIALRALPDFAVWVASMASASARIASENGGGSISYAATATTTEILEVTAHPTHFAQGSIAICDLTDLGRFESVVAEIRKTVQESSSK